MSQIPISFTINLIVNLRCEVEEFNNLYKIYLYKQPFHGRLDFKIGLCICPVYSHTLNFNDNTMGELYSDIIWSFVNCVYVVFQVNTLYWIFFGRDLLDYRIYLLKELILVLLGFLS